MSTLRVNTIQNSGGTGSPEINGLARAWVNFNGTGTVAIRASNNVSSITDNGTGDYRVNFTNSLSDANYAVSVNGRIAAGTLGILVSNSNVAGANSSSSCRVSTSQDNTTVADSDFVYVAIFR